MTPEAGILTSLMNTFTDVFNGGVGNIMGDAKWLLGTLIIIDLVLAILMNLDDADHLKTLIKKVLKYGFFIWLVVDWANLGNVVLKSFSMIGLKAGGGGLSPAFMTDPSAIAGKGVEISGPVLKFLDGLGVLNTLLYLPKIIIMGLSAVGIILCFFIIGIQVFLTYLEFYIVATLALILIPFGVFKHTAFLGEKAIGAVLGFGIKLMVLGFIASAVIPIVSSWALPTTPEYKDCFFALLGSLAIAFLAWSVPGMVSGLLMGHPSLTGGGAAGFALAGAAIAGNMGSRGHSMLNNLTGAKGRAAQKNADLIGGAVASAMKTGGGVASPPPAAAKIDAAEAATRFKPVDNRTPPK
jgi:type IV secretion system protein TrbL